MMGPLVEQKQRGEMGVLLSNGTACEGGRGCSLVYMDPMMSGKGR